MHDNLIKAIIKSNKFVSDEDTFVVDKNVSFRLRGGTKSDLILGYPVKPSAAGVVKLNTQVNPSDGQSNSNSFQFMLSRKGLSIFSSSQNKMVENWALTPSE